MRSGTARATPKDSRASEYRSSRASSRSLIFTTRRAATGPTARGCGAKLRSIVPSDTCVIFVVDEQTSKAEAVYSVGDGSEFFLERRVSVGDGITGWVIANARSMSGAHAELDTAGLPSEVASRIRDVVSSPLLREDGAFGAVTLYSSGETMYNADHVRLLESVCLHA